MKLSPLYLVVNLAFAAGSAQAMTDVDLKARVSARLDGDRTGACFAVAVIKKTVSRAYVCADPKDAARIGADTAFEIGSVSKTMTSALLAELIERKKASLDDPLADYLPKGTAVPSFEGKPILLRHIVSHTSGLPALPAVAVAKVDDPYAAMKPAALLEALKQVKLAQAPGERFEYSNYASMLLSYALARRAGRDFETLLREDLFEPLGMKTAYINRKPDGVREAVGHLPNTQATSAWHFDTDLAGVGGVRATLEDMVAYVQGQLGRTTTSIAPALSLTQRRLPGKTPIAMNWLIAPLNGREWREHAGGTGGFSSFVAFDREGDRGVVVLSDTSMTSLGGIDTFGLGLLDPSVPAQKPRKIAKPGAALLDGLAGDYRVGPLTMRLERKDDALIVHPSGQQALTMGYDTHGDFYPLIADAVLRPQKKADGSYGFVWLQGGGATPAQRTDAKPASASLPPLSAKELQAYAGEYPLAPQFSITVTEKDGVLRGQGTGQPSFEMKRTGTDLFAIESVGAEIRFERDAQQRVTALVLHQNGQVVRGARR